MERNLTGSIISAWNTGDIPLEVHSEPYKETDRWPSLNYILRRFQCTLMGSGFLEEHISDVIGISRNSILSKGSLWSASDINTYIEKNNKIGVFCLKTHWKQIIGCKCSHQYGSLAWLCCRFAQIVITYRPRRQCCTPKISKLFLKGPDSKFYRLCGPCSFCCIQIFYCSVKVQIIQKWMGVSRVGQQAVVVPDPHHVTCRGPCTKSYPTDLKSHYLSHFSVLRHYVHKSSINDNMLVFIQHQCVSTDSFICEVQPGDYRITFLCIKCPLTLPSGLINTCP